MGWSEEEFLVWSACLCFGGALWLFWLVDVALRRARCGGAARERLITLAGPFLCAGLLWALLQRFAASDVRDNILYLTFYEVVGGAWLILGLYLLPFVGFSARDEVIERRNRAAAVAIVGFQLGLTLCFAGGNIGEGPGWQVVVFSAGLSTAAFFLLWSFLDRATGLADTVTIDRDLAAGIRLVGFFAGAGLILGRAVAGNWHSYSGTLADFVLKGWPVVPLWLLAVAVERKLSPSPAEPVRRVMQDGVLPALLYAGAGGLSVLLAGPWT
jgi:uncharacterized membrane protein YjfL (UPF0719 family)